MKVLLVPVTYNSYAELHKYLSDINTSAAKANHVDIVVSIADNSTQIQPQYFDAYKNINVRIESLGNVGYFGGAGAVIAAEENISQYDYVIISNVDLSMPDDFFVKLSKVIPNEEVGWIANRIWTQAEERDKNPKILSRYSKRKLQIIRLLYRFPILDWLYTNTMYKRKNHAEINNCNQQYIYAGHGSFIILTKDFFYKCHKIEYPVFLFGEEIYLAEICKRENLKVCYNPDLIIYDNEHISTGKMKKSFYYKCNLESINYLLQTFYE